MMGMFKRCLLVLVMGVVFVMVVGVSVACAEGLLPWWGVGLAERPTNLHAGVATKEVQEITASPGSFFGRKGVFLKLMVGGKVAGQFGTEEFATAGLPEPTAGNIQKALEGEEFYGKGNVVVSGGPAGSAPLIVRSASKGPVAKIIEVTEHAGTTEAHAKVTTEGRPDGQIVVTAENLGDADANGSEVPVRIEDTLPMGLSAVAVEGVAGDARGEKGPVVCGAITKRPLVCMFGGVLHPYEPIEIRVSVVVSGASSDEVNTVSISGGGAAQTKTISRLIQVGGDETFGLQESVFTPEAVGGGVDTQAGSHPFQLTDTLTFNQGAFRNGTQTRGGGPEVLPVGLPKDVNGLLPAGLIGNPSPFVQCSDQQFLAPAFKPTNCPLASVVGVATITFDEPILLTLYKSVTPIFNLVPNVGEPARFGFDAGIIPVILDTSVRTGGDYGVTVSVHDIPEVAGLLSSSLTFWGVPGDPRHDGQRGSGCTGQENSCPLGEASPPPFLSMPTSCTGPLGMVTQTDSWGAPEEVFSTGMSEPLPGLDGCNHLSFEPSISVTPDSQSGSTPTGLGVNVHLPQSASVLDAEGLSQSTLKDTTVTLPAGVTLNPGTADGLEVCSETQVGYLAVQSHGGELAFTPDVPSCPDGSKIATVKIKTPLLPNPLEGEVYLAAQGANPFGSLFAMYLVARDTVSGTLVKLAGRVDPDPVTGQITATFKNTPQLPFEDLELHFFGGARAPLASPPLCGSYTTNAVFAPWSGEEAAQRSSTFQIFSGPNGSPCHDPLPFDPALTAGTTSIQAGGYSAFTMTMSRPDGDQNLTAIKLKMPPGLLGTLASVKLCKEEQANLGTCGPESLIGHTIVSVGVGGNPYSVTGGQVFITEEYKGAPYGLSIVNPAKAGPFDLGKVIVRAKIEVDPLTAVLTITSDSTGPYKIPTILDGIPLQIQHVNVTIDRPGFTFNPTNCSPLQIGGSLTSDQGAVQALSVPFQITNCAVLAFKPKLTAETNGKTSRANGASLSVKLTYPAGPYDANIARVKVALPRQLPSRLDTLKKACPAATFNANPAACPAASIVGHAIATTPVLPQSLTGPAYFVSHGGEAFPDLIIVLQGYGATVHLVGSTSISKTGITSSTFKSVPDVPVGTFELNLPQGKYSALAANKNLCTTKKLAMPTSFVAQNGVVINTSTPIVPTGCGKHAKVKHKAKHKHGKK
jgi:hypothetical protein